MLHLIGKNLWARRYRNGWLLAELIIVSMVIWVLTDPIVVTTHDRGLDRKSTRLNSSHTDSSRRPCCA